MNLPYVIQCNHCAARFETGDTVERRMVEKAFKQHYANIHNNEAEAYWRTRIAQEIEAEKCEPESDDVTCWGVNEEHCEVLDIAINIARGIK